MRVAKKRAVAVAGIRCRKMAAQSIYNGEHCYLYSGILRKALHLVASSLRFQKWWLRAMDLPRLRLPRDALRHSEYQGAEADVHVQYSNSRINV